MNKEEIKKLKIVYQPKVDLKTNKFIGAEVLARFIDENSDTINTESVLSLLSNYEDMKNLTTAVIYKVIDDFIYLEKLNKKLIRISINISSLEIENDNLSLWINSIFNADNKKYIKYIEFEITERNKVLSSLKLQSGIEILKNLGFKISLDDVGAGYNTIDIINNYDVDYIKLDKTLINCVLKNNLIQGFNYLKRIIDLSHSLNMKVIAEGIEDIVTYKGLSYINCDYGQGFYISNPVSLEQLINLIDECLFDIDLNY